MIKFPPSQNDNCKYEKIINAPVIEDILGVMQNTSLKNILGRETTEEFEIHMRKLMHISEFNEIAFTQKKIGNDGLPCFIHKCFYDDKSPVMTVLKECPNNINIKTIIEDKDNCELTKYGYFISKIPVPDVGYDFSILLNDDIILSGDNYGEAKDVTLSIGIIEIIVTFLSNFIHMELLTNELSIDEGTGVYNKKRRSLENFTEGHLLVIDIDFFKQVNDTYGHTAGDIVLKQIATKIKSLVRENDAVYRFGGEEFCVYLDENKKKNVVQIAERIRQSIEDMNIKINDDIIIKKTISIGVSNIKTSLSKDDAFIKADKNLYQCKHCGRNQVIYPGKNYKI